MGLRHSEVESALVLSPEQGRAFGREGELIRMDPEQVIFEPFVKKRF